MKQSGKSEIPTMNRIEIVIGSTKTIDMNVMNKHNK